MNDWIKVEDRIPNIRCATIRVKKSDGSITKSHFFKDRGRWEDFHYGPKPTYWFEAVLPFKPIYNVIEWQERKNE
jgi:hypothetical protein